MASRPAPLLRLTLPPHPQYGIVLDAGSSHTSMFIYKWPADKENDTGIVGQHSSCDVRGKGPLSAGRPRLHTRSLWGLGSPPWSQLLQTRAVRPLCLVPGGHSRQELQEPPPREAVSLGLGMAVDSSQKRSPREHLEGLGLAWPEIGSTPQVEREGSRGAGGHTQAGPGEAGPGGQHPGLCPSTCVHTHWCGCGGSETMGGPQAALLSLSRASLRIEFGKFGVSCHLAWEHKPPQSCWPADHLEAAHQAHPAASLQVGASLAMLTTLLGLGRASWNA